MHKISHQCSTRCITQKRLTITLSHEDHCIATSLGKQLACNERAHAHTHQRGCEAQWRDGVQVLNNTPCIFRPQADRRFVEIAFALTKTTMVVSEHFVAAIGERTREINERSIGALALSTDRPNEHDPQLRRVPRTVVDIRKPRIFEYGKAVLLRCAMSPPMHDGVAFKFHCEISLVHHPAHPRHQFEHSAA